MLKYVRWISCGIVFALAIGGMGWTMQSSAAQDSAAGNTYKIGVVDLQRVLADYDKRKQKYEELQAEVEKLQADIDALSKTIEDNKKYYEEGKATMSEDERFKLRESIENDYTKYQIELKSRQSKIDNMEERVLKEVFEDIQQAISEIAEKENYHLVLNANRGPRGSVLYHSATIDVTSAVLAKLNSK